MSYFYLEHHKIAIACPDHVGIHGTLFCVTRHPRVRTLKIIDLVVNKKTYYLF